MTTQAPAGTVASALDAARQRAIFTAMRAGITAAHLPSPPVVMGGARRIGRAFGAMPFNRKRVTNAVERVGVALPELPAHERLPLVLKSYEHICMLGAELAIAPRLISEDTWPEVVELGNIDRAMRPLLSGRPLILLTGHCGNWEVLGYTLAMLGYRMHVLYRPIDLKPADRWVRQTRSRRGLFLLDKFGAMHMLPELLAHGESVGFVADQNAGERGLHVPFFNRLASSYKSIALLAMQHDAPILVGQARRLPPSPGHRAGVKYRIDLADAFGPEDWSDQPDPMFYITARYRRAIETMVRIAPEQYLWMHRIWKSRPRHERLDKPFPGPLLDKLRALPWMTEPELEALVDRSDRDRAMLKERGLTQMP